MPKMTIKTPEEIEKMREGGQKLGQIRDQLMDAVAEGVNALQIEELANKLITEAGAEASFKKVHGYSWATCVNVNDGVVHGIPKSTVVFKKGDVVSVDVGLYYKGFHTDTSSSVVVGKDAGKEKFLKNGRSSLDRAIEQAKVGNTIYDISEMMEKVLLDAGLTPIEALTGHGIGKHLHEDPYIPCFTKRMSRSHSVVLTEGMTLAIEVMYTQGSPELETEEDSWTIRTKDGKLSALFEETVAVVNNGPIILTRSK